MLDRGGISTYRDPGVPSLDLSNSPTSQLQPSSVQKPLYKNTLYWSHIVIASCTEIARGRDYRIGSGLARVKGCENTSFVGLSGVECGFSRRSILTCKGENTRVWSLIKSKRYCAAQCLSHNFISRTAAIPRSLERIISLLQRRGMIHI